MLNVEINDVNDIAPVFSQMGYKGGKLRPARFTESVSGNLLSFLIQRLALVLLRTRPSSLSQPRMVTGVSSSQR